jgi:pSer/pThr/pTyr-binding forkhead associated (FHA) protein
MAVTIHIKHGEPELVLTVDAPRVVIGRSKSCEIQLLDPTVSPRHASLRLDQGAPVVIDEGSTNGVIINGLRIPARTPWPIDDGQIIRIGRVWLEIELVSAPVDGGDTLNRARAVAFELLERQLAELGEGCAPSIEVVEGADLGVQLDLGDLSREYRVGRALDADLSLSDALISRHHIMVWREAGECRVRDGGSKRGTTLNGTPLDTVGRAWREGEELKMGDTTMVLHSPLDEAFEDAFTAADVRMRSDERAEPPPGQPSPEPPPVEDEPRDETPVLPTYVERVLTEPSGRTLGSLDLMVALLAVGVLCMSAAGLWWVLYG